MLLFGSFAGRAAGGADFRADGSKKKEPPALVNSCNQNPRLPGATRPLTWRPGYPETHHQRWLAVAVVIAHNVTASPPHVNPAIAGSAGLHTRGLCVVSDLRTSLRTGSGVGARLFAGLHIHAGHDWFQTGYLTITAEERLGGKVLYRLGYPNREVRQSLNDHLLRHLVQDTAQQTANSIRLARLLEAHDCAGLKTLFHAFFASIPYQWYTNNHIADAQPDAEQVLLASRALSMQVDEDGMVVLRGRLPPEVGAVLLRAVEAALEQVPASADGGAPTIAQRRADALGLVAESALAGGLDPGNPADRFQVTVHVQADALPARDPADAAPHVAAETRELSLTPSEPVAHTANLGAEQATIAAPHISAETFEVSEAAGERAALETDLDAGQAVIEQAGGLHLGRRRPAAWPAMPASWCCATPLAARSWMSGAGPAPSPAPCAAPCSAGIAASASFPAASRATATPITSSTGRTAGRPACRTWFWRAGFTTARCTKGACGWFRLTRMASSGSCARTARRCRQSRRRQAGKGRRWRRRTHG